MAPGRETAYTNNGSNKANTPKPNSYVYSAIIENFSLPFLLSARTTLIAKTERISKVPANPAIN